MADGHDEYQENLFRLPRQKYFTLQEACELKGLNIKTARNNPALQPNRGLEDGRLGGRKVFSYEVVAEWIDVLD